MELKQIQPDFRGMILELVNDIMSIAETPDKAITQILEEIRELTGAKVIIAYRCAEYNPKEDKHKHTIIEVLPKRKKELINATLFEKLSSIAHTRQGLFVVSDENPGPEYQELKNAGLDLSILLPVKFKKKTVGGFLILGLPTKYNLEIIVDGLNSISDMLALVFRYSLLYLNMEKLVEERTTALQYTEEQFRDIFEYSPLGKSITSLDGSIKTNKAFSEILGYSEKELKTKKWQEITHPDDIKLSEQVVQKLLDGKTNKVEFEKRYIHKNESIVWTSAVVSLKRNQKNKPEYFLTTIKDITEQKKASEDLKHREEEFRTVIEAAGDAIYVADFETGQILLTNQQASTALGYSIKELLNKTVFELDLDFKPQNYHENIWEKMIQGEMNTIETVHQKKNGSIFPVEVRTGIISFRGKKAVLGFARDITQRKKAETELRESQDKFRSLVEKSLNAIFTVNNRQVFTFVNPAFCKLTGYTESELTGMNFEQLLPPESKALVKERYKKRQAGKKVPSRYEFKILTKDSSIRFVEISSDVITDKNNNPLTFAHLSDITERKVAEEQLRESEERYRVFFENNEAIIMLVDPENGNIIFANNAAANFYGYNKKVLTSMNANQINTMSPKKMKEKIAEAAKRKQNYFVAKHKLASGKIRDVEVYQTKLRFKNREVFSIIVHDITKRKKAEQELIRLSTAITQSPSVVLITDLQGRIEYVNPRFTELTGYSAEEAIGQFSNILKAGDQNINFYKELWDTVTAGNTWHGEFHNKKKNGELFWEAASISPIADKNGTIINYLKVAEDITRQKAVQQKLAESEDRLSKTLKAANDGTWDWNLTTNEVYFDPRYYQMAGYEVNEFPHHLSEFQKRVHPDDIDDVMSEVQKHIEGKTKRFRVQFRFETKTGKWMWILGRGIIVENDENNKPIRLVGSHTDFTKQKELELKLQKQNREYAALNEEYLTVNEELMANVNKLNELNTELITAKEKAEEADRLKSAFLANMSHEIRTPMNGILGFLQLLKEPSLDETEKADYINIVNRSGKRLLDTINDIIEISKIDSGEIQLENQEIRFDNFLRFYYDFFKPQTDKKGIELLLSNEVEVQTIIADKNKLNSILTNLIKNAIKFTEKGSIKFGCIPDGNNLKFFVKDTGKGIQKEHLETVFGRFVQEDVSLTRGHEGSGLGLSICKAYADALDGKIWVESEPGKGASFYLTIPLKKTQNKPAELTKPTKTNVSWPRKIKILIAEDDNASFLFLNEILKKKDCEIHRCVNGYEAVEFCQANSDTDLILMDIKMPEMDGIKATQKIRGFNADVRIIAQTAHAMAGDYKKALQAGCDDYIAKPIRRTLLIEKIAQNIKDMG